MRLNRRCLAREPLRWLSPLALWIAGAGCGPVGTPDAADVAIDAATDAPMPDSSAPCVFSDAGTPQTLDTVYALVLSRRCGTSGTCHFNSTEPPAGLDMSTLAMARSRLIGGPAATGGFCMPGGVSMRVVPGNLNDSMLWRRITGTSCAERMPLGAAPLSCDDQGLIRNWILGGAM